MVRKLTIAFSVALVLSVVAAGAVTATEVQKEATIDRTAPDTATVEETITVEVAVRGTALVESFDRDGVNATIVDRDGANAAVLSDRVVFKWNENGEHTVEYEVEVPAAAGEELTIDGEAIASQSVATSSNTTIGIDGYGVDHYAEPGKAVEHVRTVQLAWIDAQADKTSVQVVQKLWISFINEEPLEPAG